MTRLALLITCGIIVVAMGVVAYWIRQAMSGGRTFGKAMEERRWSEKSKTPKA